MVENDRTQKNLSDMTKSEKREFFRLLNSKCGRIVKGVSYTYGQNSWMDIQDVEQNLWLKTLEIVEEKGGIDNASADFIAKSCLNRAVDGYRHEKMVNKKIWYTDSIDYTVPSKDGDNANYSSNGSDSDDDSDHFSQITSRNDHIVEKPLECDPVELSSDMIVEIRAMFESVEMTKTQRRYVVAKLVNDGLITEEFFPEEDLSLPNSGDNEADFTLHIGYKTPRPGSWRRERDRLKELIHEYFENQKE